MNLPPWLIDCAIYYAFRSWGYTPSNAEWIVMQSRGETGNYTSKAFREDKNLFGMSRVTQRETTQSGWRYAQDGSDPPNTIGRYKTLYDSIRDRRLWDTERAGLDGKEQNYQSRLDAKWGVPGYLPWVAKFRNNLELDAGRKYVMGGFFVLLAAVYLAIRAKK